MRIISDEDYSSSHNLNSILRLYLPESNCNGAMIPHAELVLLGLARVSRSLIMYCDTIHGQSARYLLHKSSEKNLELHMGLKESESVKLF